ncbi:uncharacterized protein FPRO_00415 [Fusarium proliferatum ET1]|uniref:Uncharacterized protein n=1 Tax=Fusarium proliferatum (strain ET1) TaxID=1227346 RepID=A0A1L7V5P9_FUSPR|nr:uncharacterized protein FPRO_00415 [Fusarium proliferatum ET1]CZR35462.1 uncharacterized protein FPRO_00415 [Fusarium proliferatum ET1]
MFPACSCCTNGITVFCLCVLCLVLCVYVKLITLESKRILDLQTPTALREQENSGPYCGVSK